MTSQRVETYSNSEPSIDSEGSVQLRFNKDILEAPDQLISIIIPVYNEENTIKEVISGIPNHHRYEIIVVNDGCTDKSVQRLQEIKNRSVRVYHHEKNFGYGAAILTGLTHAKGDIIVTLDSDGQHIPQEIPNLIKPLLKNECDIVIGSRYLGACNYAIPLHTKIGEGFIDFALWFLFDQNVRNNQSGFRAFNRKSLELFDNLIYNKFGLCTEIIFKAALHGLRMKEVPITVKPRDSGISNVHLIKITISLISCVLIYGMKKFRIIEFIPKTIIEKLSKRIIK